MGTKGDRTKQLIRETACVLFAEKGFKQVTMKDICEATALSRGGLYRHYDNTRQIFSEIIDDLMQRQDDEFQSKISQGLSATTILDEVLERYRQEMLDSANTLSFAIYEYFSDIKTASGQNALSTQYEYSASMWRNLIRYGMECGEFKVVDEQAVFDLIVFSYQGVRMCSRIMPMDKEIPKRMIIQIKKNLLKEETCNVHNISKI